MAASTSWLEETAMPGLLIGNVDSSATDDDLRELLERHGFPPWDSIQHMPGDGSRPAVLVTYEGAPPEALRILQPRLNELFWKNRKINVSVLDLREDPGAAKP
jgi:hypothetical protein